MVKKIIAVDLDDVVADTTNALRLEVNKIAQANLTPEHYQIDGEYWGYYEHVWVVNKIDHLVSFDALHDDMSVTQKHVEIIEGAKSALEKLKKHHRLVAVTSRKVQWVNATHEWLEDKLPGIFEDVIFVHHDDNDGRTKGDACVDTGAEWLIDDNSGHCLSAKCKGVKAVLFGNYGWNRRAPEKYYDVRAVNWQEVLEYFDGQS
ncbi:MAG TPA: hypothetical protein PKA02_02380 [Candidatus Saccharibacteria bacterium]|nr:hypothetical protein [Candidatus Saccharibacteria bacterium]